MRMQGAGRAAHGSPRTWAGAVRPPAVAGRFYPADPQRLTRMVRTLLSEASGSATRLETALAGVRALLAPHAGYPCSGVVAAAAFGALGVSCAASSAPFTVYLAGPAHWAAVDGAGLSTLSAFATPLGEVPVARERVEALLAAGAPFCAADRAHAPEHCLEVELPFLQTVLRRCSIVPLLLDEGAEPGQVAAALGDALAADPHSLLVVSSDLSHYRAYEDARARDREFLAALEAGEQERVARGEACGLIGIRALLRIAARFGWTAHVLDYRNSGDTCGGRDQVVGYGAAVFCHPSA